MRRLYPDVNYIQGDIRNPETLYNGMVGHDVVIHAAAVKVIPASEWNSLDTIDVNVAGSQIVCGTALRAHIQHVLGISTDKACHPANAYGASKMLMEKIFHEYARLKDPDIQFHLVRYGNVLESTGSVVEAWHKAVQAHEPIKMTDPNMTRFWLSPCEAAEYALAALAFESGITYIPLMPGLSIKKLAEYTVGDHPIQIIPLRPGEKIHETLITTEERYYGIQIGGGPYLLRPTTEGREMVKEDFVPTPYSSDMAPELSADELTRLLRNE